MTDTIRAPWTSEQADALNRFQVAGGMHPFTCGADHIGSSPVLDATHSGWICPDPACAYMQDWAHTFMADPAEWPVPQTGQLIGGRRPGHVVGHATIGIDVAATEPTDTVEAIRARVQDVVAELRARVAERESGVDGKLPMGHPMALWCDTVSNIAYQIEYALRTPTPARGLPLLEQP